MDNFYTKLRLVDNSREKLWSKALDLIKNQISPANFKMWFSKASYGGEVDGKLIIYVPTAFVQAEITTKHQDLVHQAIEAVFDQELPFELKVNSSKSEEGDLEREEELEFSPPTPQLSTAGLNPKYTLKNFVVGLSNNLAYAAAQAVVQNPGTSYNPLFVYGGTGVGKTHLMHGIGNALLEKNPQTKIIYCSSEKFMNDLIQSIQNRRTGDFRAKYRACDLLLIDDIQFISGRDSTQEEFFHTFNELQAKNSQIILTSDRPPNDIQKLESRLQSRFQGGLMVDIQVPDFDTRVAILKAKCTGRGEELPENLLTLIAEAMPTNARELEGKLMQIVQTAKLTGQTLSEEFIQNYLGKPQVSSSQKMDYKKVISSVNQHFNLKMADITGPRRKKELVFPRQLAMYLLYQECKLPFERIGELLGGRDHTTIMHGVEKINEAASRDRDIQKVLIELKQSILE